MRVLWREQSLADVNQGDEWLSAGEQSHLAGLRIPKRHADWRLGRWTAKHAVADYLNLPHDSDALAGIEICAAPSGAPEAFFEGITAPASISLSHRDGVAACAVADPGAVLGCDLEVVEPRSQAFVCDYFTADEQAMIEQVSPTERYRLIALLWSAKESTLKALRTGLRSDTRSVAVNLDEHTLNSAFESSIEISTKSPLARDGRLDLWHPLHVHHGLEVFHGRWCCDDRWVRTLILSDLTSVGRFPQGRA